MKQLSLQLLGRIKDYVMKTVAVSENVSITISQRQFFSKMVCVIRYEPLIKTLLYIHSKLIFISEKGFSKLNSFLL